jgi:hypothetical protein
MFNILFFLLLQDAFTGCQILPCSHKVHKECATQMIRSGMWVFYIAGWDLTVTNCLDFTRKTGHMYILTFLEFWSIYFIHCIEHVVQYAGKVLRTNWKEGLSRNRRENSRIISTNKNRCHAGRHEAACFCSYKWSQCLILVWLAWKTQDRSSKVNCNCCCIWLRKQEFSCMTWFFFVLILIFHVSSVLC